MYVCGGGLTAAKRGLNYLTVPTATNSAYPYVVCMYVYVHRGLKECMYVCMEVSF